MGSLAPFITPHDPTWFSCRAGSAPRSAALTLAGDASVFSLQREPFNFTPHGGQFDFVWLSARTPHGAYVW